MDQTYILFTSPGKTDKRKEPVYPPSTQQSPITILLSLYYNVAIYHTDNLLTVQITNTPFQELTIDASIGHDQRYIC